MRSASSSTRSCAASCVGLAHSKRDLQVAGVRQQRGFHVGVRGVDRRQQLVCLRLRNHGRFQSAHGNRARRHNCAQPRQAFGVKQRPALVRRARNEHHELAIAAEGGVEPLARRAAIGVGQQRRALQNIGLLQIVLRHRDAPRGGARMQSRNLRGVAPQSAARAPRQQPRGSDRLRWVQGRPSDARMSHAAQRRANGDAPDPCAGRPRWS